MIQLLPNRDSKKGSYQPGMFIRLPKKNALFRFKVERPFGLERRWVFASNRPLPILEGKNLPNGLKLIKIEVDLLRQNLRKQKQTSYGEAQLSITIRARENVKSN